MTNKNKRMSDWAVQYTEKDSGNKGTLFLDRILIISPIDKNNCEVMFVGGHTKKINIEANFIEALISLSGK